MRELYILSVGWLLTVPLAAQLVNPGFELYTTLPDNTGQWYTAVGWGNCGSLSATPDYYHYLCPSNCDLPETPMAVVNPFQGSAVMGLIASGVSGTNVREYICTELTSPMQVGREYIVGFKITNGLRTAVSTGGLGTSGLGLYFSQTPPLQNGLDPIMVQPQFRIDTVLYSRHWITINFIFEASQNFKYLTFGLFGDDSDKVIEVMEGDHPQFAYYFLDAFFMEMIPEDYNPAMKDNVKGDTEEPHVPAPVVMGPEHEQDFFVPNTFTPNGDGNNDEFRPVSFSVSQYEFAIYSRWGELIYRTSDPLRGWDGNYHGRKASCGAYVWEIVYYKPDAAEGLVQKQCRGIVNLVR